MKAKKVSKEFKAGDKPVEDEILNAILVPHNREVLKRMDKEQEGQYIHYNEALLHNREKQIKYDQKMKDVLKSKR